MLARSLPALSALLLVGCGQSAPADDRSLDERFYAAREARCEKYGIFDPGYEAVPIEQVESILQSRHEGERMMAHLSPEHYCAAIKRFGERTCYRFFASAIDVGGGVEFCTDRDGNVSDVELGE